MQVAAQLKLSLEQKLDCNNGNLIVAFCFPNSTKLKQKFHSRDVTKVSLLFTFCIVIHCFLSLLRGCMKLSLHLGGVGFRISQSLQCYHPASIYHVVMHNNCNIMT